MAIEDFDQVTIAPAKLRPFSKFIMSIGELPTSYLDSLSYAEQVTWFCDYLQNQVIPALNNNAQALQEVQNLMTELQTYVNDYFDNLDVQEEIDNKIDEMVESGQFEQIIFSNLTYVTYEMFGAKLDGETDDTEAVINCHNYANQYKLKVVQNRGTLYIPSATKDNCPIINTSCDFTGMTIKFDSNNDDNTVMIIADPSTLDLTKDINSVNLNDTQISELYPNNLNKLSHFSDYYNNAIYLTTDMSFGQRNGSDTVIYYEQPFIINDIGQLAPNNMYANISANATNVTMHYLPLDQNNVEVKFDKIEITGNTSNNPRILVMRNNIKIQNAIINKINSTLQTEWIQPLFECKYCTNINIENFKGNTPTFETYGTDITNYVISFYLCYNINFKENELLKGHGAFTSYFCSFINFDKNYINRFDNHYGLYGEINITNTNIVGYPCKINLGYGNANVNVVNCNFYNYQENGKSINEDVISCRTDLAVLFSGTLNVNNCNLIAKEGTNNSNYVGIYQWINDPSNHADFPAWADYNLPIVNINQIFYELTNLSFRLFRIYNNLDHAYTLRDINTNLSSFRSQGTSLIDIPNITQLSNTYVNLKNVTCKIFASGGAISFNLYDHSKLESAVNTTNANVYEQANLAGTFNVVNNYGITTLENNTTMTTALNSGTLISNNSTYNNLRSTGRLMGTSVTISSNAYISGICQPTALINNGTINLSGAYFEVTTLTNTNKTINIAGCVMNSTQAGKFQDNGTIHGNGNYGGTNSQYINTL